ncbi:MAG TPA: DUF5947 family protein [Acidimicrobiales bacterium]|nr:DUF5947 family protein [Acidimicrobiales bacterium]
MTGTDPPEVDPAGAIAGRIDALLDELTADGDARAEELAALVTELHREGLQRALAVVADGPGGRAALEKLGDDEVVGGLLVLHDLHPHDLPTRVARALGRLKPALGAARAHVAVDRVDEDAGVHLTLTTAVGTPGRVLADAVERAVLAAAPEAAEVVVRVDEPSRAEPGPSPAPVPVAISPRPEPGQDPAPVPVAVRPRPERSVPGELCDLCGTAVPDGHRHLVDVEERRLICACQACGLLFEHDAGPAVLGFPLTEPLGALLGNGTTTSPAPEGPGRPAVAGGRRYRGLPQRCVALPRPGVPESLWATLQIPVGVAFLFHSSGQGGMVAFYPGPAGATESLLPLDAWDELTATHPMLETLEPDVEALLVRTGRLGVAGEAYVVPIDICYELVGALRTVWRGFDGGTEARERLDALFARVAARAVAPVAASP